MKIILKDGRGGSNKGVINNLIEDFPFVIGDNHRFAPWYWIQETKVNEPYSLIHIDHHYDDDNIAMQTVVQAINDPFNMTIEDFLSKKLSHSPTESAVDYANIISYFAEVNPHHQGGIFINANAILQGSMLKFNLIPRDVLPDFLKSFSKCVQHSILDIDLDYFSNDDWDYVDGSMNYIEAVFNAINTNLSNYDLITIALSPSTTHKGWDNVDKILHVVNTIFNKDYSF